MKKICLVSLIVFALPIFGMLPSGAAHLGARFNLAIPQDEFDTYVDDIGFGGDFDLTYAINPNLNLGIAGGYLKYGKETRTEPFSTTISTVNVDVITSNQIAYLHLLSRVSIGYSLVNPYIEGRVGGSYIWTDTQIRSEEFNDDDDVIAESKNFDDFAFNAGFGGGLQIRLKKPNEEVDGWTYLDLKVLYIYGSNAEYLTEGAIDDSSDDLDVTYNISESKTSLLEIQLGLNFVF
ncbi:MAG: hypothetical protein ACLFSQ_07775 [Candidatus Zixiibacteriota bacterium]